MKLTKRHVKFTSDWFSYWVFCYSKSLYCGMLTRRSFVYTCALFIFSVRGIMGQPGPVHFLTIKQFCDSKGEIIFFFAIPNEKGYKNVNHSILSTKGYSLKAYRLMRKQSKSAIIHDVERKKIEKHILYGRQNDIWFDILKQYKEYMRSDTVLARKFANYSKLATYLETRAYQHARDTVLKIQDPNNLKTYSTINDLYTFLLSEELQSLNFVYGRSLFTLLLEFKNSHTKEVMYLLIKDIYRNEIDEVCFQPGYYVINARKISKENITPTDWQKIRVREDMKGISEKRMTKRYMRYLY
ncbi:hypothetical protein QNI16_37435 [Cytophagaceae bacterium YF14B1]|uniref:Uncharacterized protein n=1 Tax=Xanthocytophaga flava TaxID=3048013 RepID=A0AAE3UBX9_9BACT|nr:hypothetical protein [Xanthocytophaga flavus]MDJ1486227.1 hypothetical protein [Xanthocytophaga flavus]